MPAFVDIEVDGRVVPKVEFPDYEQGQVPESAILEVGNDIRRRWAEETTQAEINDNFDVISSIRGPQDAVRKVSEGDTSILPTVLRVGGAVVGGGLGALLGPGGAIAGGVIGSGLGDLAAQGREMQEGSRDELNLGRTALEAGLGAIPGRAFTAGRPLLRGAAFGVGSQLVEDTVEGRQVSGPAQLGIAAATGGLINLAAVKGFNKLFKSSVDDLTGGVDELYDEAERQAVQLKLPGITEAVKERENIVEHFAKEATKRANADEVQEIIQGEQELFGFATPTSVGKAKAKAKRAAIAAQAGVKSFKEATRVRASAAHSKFVELMRKVLPTGESFARIQERTGITVFDDWRRLEDLRGKYMSYLDRHMPELKPIFSGTSAEKRVQYSAWLEAPDKAAVEKALNFSKQDRINVRKLRGIFDKHFTEFGINPDRYLTDYLPRLRMALRDLPADVSPDEYNAAIRRAFGDNVPKEVKFFAEFSRKDGAGVDFRELDSLKLVSRYIREGAFKKFVGDQYNLMSYKYRYDKPFIKDFDKRGVNVTVDAFNSYLQTFRRPPSAVFSTIDDAVDRVVRFVSRAEGRKVPEGLSEKVVGEIAGMYYGGLMGWRIPTMMRNSFQPIQTTYPLIGGRHLLAGLAEASTKEGKELALAKGVIRGDVESLHELRDLTSSRLLAGARKLTDKSLAGFQGVENWSRRVTYLGARRKFLDAAKQVGTDDVKKLFDVGDVDMLHRVMQNDIEKILKADGLEAAADRYAKDIVQSAMFGYGQGERGELFRGTGGRALGAFGIWPSAYASYLGNIRSMPTHKAKRAVARLLGANAALASSIGLTGKYLSDSEDIETDTGWLLFGQLGFTGGPIKDLALSGIEGSTQLLNAPFKAGITGVVHPDRALDFADQLTDDPIETIKRVASDGSVVDRATTRTFSKAVLGLIPGTSAIEDFRKAASVAQGQRISTAELFADLPANAAEVATNPEALANLLKFAKTPIR